MEGRGVSIRCEAPVRFTALILSSASCEGIHHKGLLFVYIDIITLRGNRNCQSVRQWGKKKKPPFIPSCCYTMLSKFDFILVTLPTFFCVMKMSGRTYRYEAASRPS